ncbi:MAG: hypothetical protein AAFY48_11160 [Bacteroidota bacterium]
MRADDYLKLDQYLQNELSEAEKTAFEARLTDEPDLADELNVRQQMNTYLRTQAQLPDLEKKMAGLSTQYFDDAAKPRVRQMARRRLLYVVAAAAVVALLLFVWNPFSPSGTQLYADYVQHPPLAFVVKGSLEEQVATAERAFRAKEYETVYQSLQGPIAAGEGNPQLQLAFGISALETGRFEEAQRTFAPLAAGASAQREYGLWYQIMTYVRSDNFPQAIELLQKNQFKEPLLKEKAAALRSELE